MKHASVTGVLCAGVMAFASASVNAAFIDLGNGLIYDDAQDLTWTQDAGLSGWVNWQEATDWAASLTLGGVGGWRLPTTTQFDDPTCGSDVRGGLFYEHRLGCLGGEMEVLASEAGSYNFFTKTLGDAPFENVNKTRYWTATPYRDGTDPCIYYPNYDVPCTITGDTGDRTGFYWQWGFGGFAGEGAPPTTINDIAFKTTMSGTTDRYAWAVHDGMVGAVPLPAAVWLFGSGLLGLFGMMRRKVG